MQRSIQTERRDYHDERVQEIGTICEATEGEQCPKGEKIVHNTCTKQRQYLHKAPAQKMGVYMINSIVSYPTLQPESCFCYQ
jgi:hypothetical protein